MIKTVYLYTCLTKKMEMMPIKRPLLAWIRNQIRQITDYWQWRLFGTWKFYPWTYSKVHNSNKGDVAIREAICDLLMQSVQGHKIQIVKLAWGDLTSEVIEAINRDNSIFIIGGSGYYQYANGNINQQFKNDLHFLLSINCPIITFCVGMNSILNNRRAPEQTLLNADSLDMLRIFVERLTLSSVRDNISVSNFVKMGLPAPYLIPDPALFLKPSATAVPETKRRRIGLNFAFHGPATSSLLRPNINVYCQTLRRIQQETDCEFIYFIHYDSECLIVKFLRQAGLAITVVNAPPKEMLAWYATLDIHLCQMLHSSILSLNAGIPTVNLAYDQKNLAFFDLMGVARYCVPAADITPDILASLLTSLLAERSEVAEHLRERKLELSHTMDEFIRRVADLAVVDGIPSVVSEPSVTAAVSGNAEPVVEVVVPVDEAPVPALSAANIAEAGTLNRRRVSRQLVHGSAWMITMRWSIRLIGLVSTIILARLLAPESFGLVAKAMIVVGFLEVLTDTGQRLALIRHPAPTREHYDSAWSVSVLIGLGVVLAILLVAPFSDVYLNEPSAPLLVAVLSVRVFLAAFENIGTVNFRRDMDFGAEFRYGVYKKMSSFVITIGLAFWLRNYWALVYGIIIGQFVFVLISYMIHPYRPRWCLTKVRELWSFSIWTMINSVGGYMQRSLDQVMVASVADAQTMGFYSVGAEIASIPTIEVVDPMARGLYPVYAKLSGDLEELRLAYINVLGMIAIICAFGSASIALVASDLIQIILGSQWGGAVPYMICLAIASGISGISLSVNTVLTAAGEPRRVALQSWGRLLVALPCFYLGMKLNGALGITYAMLVVAVIMTPSFFYQLMQVIPVTTGQLLAVTWRPILAALVMAAAFQVLSFDLFISTVWILLPAKIVAAGGIFSVTLLGLWVASGCPSSAEKMILAFARTAVGGFLYSNP